jgi:hypothetical protein
MTRLADATFETGNLTGTSDSLTSVTGTVTLDSTSKISGQYSAAIAAVASSFARISGLAETDIYLSFNVYITAFPSSTSLRLAFISDSSGNIQMRVLLFSDGTLRMTNAAATQIGSFSTALSLNTKYRIGMHYRAGSGANSVIEFWLAQGNAAFGTAVATSSTQVMTATAGRIDIGNTSGSSPFATLFIDNVRVDNVSMPGATTTIIKTLTVTITPTLTIKRAISKILSKQITITALLNKNINKTIRITISTSLFIVKHIMKIMVLTITPTSFLIETLNKYIVYNKILKNTFASNVVERIVSAFGKKERNID